MEYSSSQEEVLEVICSADANKRSLKMLKLFESTLNLIIDKSKVSVPRHFCSAFADFCSKLWNVKLCQQCNSLSRELIAQMSLLCSCRNDRVYERIYENAMIVWVLVYAIKVIAMMILEAISYSGIVIVRNCIWMNNATVRKSKHG